MFQEGKFTLMNMKNGVLSNVRKHRDIKNVEQYITLEISLKVGNMDKMKITSSEPKNYLIILDKGLISFMGLKIIRR